MTHVIEITPDEIIATISRSNLSTLITEGSDDYYAYRQIEQRLSESEISVLAAGGKSCVLEVFRRRSEIPADKKVAFIVDRDLWIFTGVPKDLCHPKLVLTTGFSLENDLYVDGNVERLLSRIEDSGFRKDLAEYTKFYTWNVDKFLADEPYNISAHPREALDSGGFKEKFLEKHQYDGSAGSTYEYVLENYTTALRGKTLYEIIMEYLSESRRKPKHSRRALLEYGVAARGQLMLNIYDAVTVAFET